jgi:hypothetical protein
VTSDSRAQQALLTLQRDREELQAAFRPAAGAEQPRGDFPRSATFRWLAGHLNVRALASTAASAALLRPSLLRLVAGYVLTRRAAKRDRPAASRRHRHRAR